MKAVLQRVLSASVSVEGEVLGAIQRGLVVFAGVAVGDSVEEAQWLARKVSELRIFSDDAGKFNLSLADVGAAVLVVSQFTLLGDARKGRRPSFIAAARSEDAEPLVEELADSLRRTGLRVETGRFGAKMQIELINDGPVTIILDSKG